MSAVNLPVLLPGVVRGKELIHAQIDIATTCLHIDPLRTSWTRQTSAIVKRSGVSRRTLRFEGWGGRLPDRVGVKRDVFTCLLGLARVRVKGLKMGM